MDALCFHFVDLFVVVFAQFTTLLFCLVLQHIRYRPRADVVKNKKGGVFLWEQYMREEELIYEKCALGEPHIHFHEGKY